MATAQPIQASSTYSSPQRVQHVPSSSQYSSQPVYNTGSASPSTLKSWASAQQNLDIYMVNAFYLGTGQRKEYFMSFWKTATCFGLQVVGILILMENQYAVYQEENQGCSADIKGNVAFIGYLFATYITFFCTEQIRTLNRYGMYGWGGNPMPDFVNSMWVGVGLWVNLFSLILSWFVSCIIIFTSADLLEMMLNAVAVTFMLTLDDEIIGASDYTRIEQWDGGNNSACRAVDTIYDKIGALLLKIWPCWQRRIQVKNCTFECCDLLLLPFMIIIPFIVLFCYPNPDQLCLYEEASILCIAG